MKFLKLTVSFLACTSVAAAAEMQVPQRDARKPVVPAANAAPAPEGTATLAGTVVADASGAPVRLAYVVLIGAGTGVLKVTSSDSTGKFSFTKLPADRYTVGASKLPYLGAVAGARRPARPGVPIVLANGASITDVAIRLPMSAAISGTVYDERGQPAPGVNVSLQQRKMQNGERVLVPAGGGVVTTDDRGFYRIHGLSPGEYLVTALPLRQGVSGARTLTDAEVDAALRGSPLPAQATNVADQNVAYALVYFPGTTRVNDAQPVLLATGEDRQNIDVRLERVRTARVEGTVVTSDGQPLPPVGVFISTTLGSSPLQGTSTVRVGPDGRFSFSNSPGSYTLVARTLSGSGGQFALAQVELAGVDVPVQLALRPPLTFPGRLSAKGTAAAPTLSGHLIQLLPLSRALGGTAAPSVSVTSATGEFTVGSVFPGRYVIGNAPLFGASAASVVWGLESVTIDGKDVTDLPVTITTESVPKDLSVVISDRWQELSGRLTDAEGKGVSDYTVLVFPVNDAYWVNASRRIVIAQPGTDGKFTIGGPGPAMLPAGEYYLAAVTDVSKDEQYDPAFLQSIIPAALKITLAPGGRQTQDLRVR